MEIKRATTYREQLSKIRERGCLIEDESTCLKILEVVNYYRLTAYFLPFRNSDSNYLPGTSLEKVYGIYEFDRLLRQILFSALEEIEIALRSRLAYFFVHKHSPTAYLDGSNFSKYHNHEKFIETLQREIDHNSNMLFVKHHKEKYGGIFPLWVATELFSFGMLSYFYADMINADQKEFSREYYNTIPKNLKSWLRCATDLRNICAHYGRLYYRIFSAVPANITEINQVQERSLWAAFLAIRNLYPNHKKWNEQILPEIEKLFDKFKDCIQLNHISFPTNWRDLAQAD
jgi:abortive infection bacteriophage resistance protein